MGRGSVTRCCVFVWLTNTNTSLPAPTRRDTSTPSGTGPSAGCSPPRRIIHWVAAGIRVSLPCRRPRGGTPPLLPAQVRAPAAARRGGSSTGLPRASGYHFLAGAHAAGHLHSFRHRSERRLQPAEADHPLGCRGHQGIVEPGANISNAPFPNFPGKDRGLSVEPPVALTVSEQDFRGVPIMALRLQLLGP